MPPAIRLATLDDAEKVRAIYAPYCSTPISFEMDPPSVDEMQGRLAKVLGCYPWLVCEEGGEVLGYAYATQHRERAAYRWSVDSTVYVRQGRQRRGVGRALCASQAPGGLRPVLRAGQAVGVASCASLAGGFFVLSTWAL
jgi:phosphinothricin acetyltransferase